MGRKTRSLQEVQTTTDNASASSSCLAQLGGTSLGVPQGDPREGVKEGVRGAVLAQMCQLAVAVPGVPGERQRLHFVEGEVAGQLGEPVVLQVSSLQRGHAGKCVV